MMFIYKYTVSCYNLNMENSLFTNLISLKDASMMWKIDDSVLRRAISSNKLVENVDVKKFGKQWVVTKQAMERVYGYIPAGDDEPYSKRKMQAALMIVSKLIYDFSLNKKISLKEATEILSNHKISELIIDCFDYYEHCSSQEILEEIIKKIKEGFYYERNR